MSKPYASLLNADEQKFVAENAAKILVYIERRYVPEPMSGCWLWTKHLNSTGYGRAYVLGRSYAAHSLSLVVHGKSIPQGMFSLHKCDQPSCVNPDHLYAGTHQQNMDDKVARNRIDHSGDKHPCAKLTNSEAYQLRRALRAGEITSKAASDRYGMSYSAMNMLKHGQTWQLLDEWAADNAAKAALAASRPSTQGRG